jgi:hypothetical protein
MGQAKLIFPFFVRNIMEWGHWRCATTLSITTLSIRTLSIRTLN